MSTNTNTNTNTEPLTLLAGGGGGWQGEGVALRDALRQRLAAAALQAPAAAGVAALDALAAVQAAIDDQAATLEVLAAVEEAGSVRAGCARAIGAAYAAVLYGEGAGAPELPAVLAAASRVCALCGVTLDPTALADALAEC